MTEIDYAAALRREGALLARAARQDLDARIEHCPDWDVGDLVTHVFMVHDFWRRNAAGDLATPDEYIPPSIPTRDALVDAFEVGVDETARTIYAIDASTPMWSWSQQQDVGFAHRRMPQETQVHRWDAESAVGPTTPFDRDLAADGIDEFVRIFLPSDPEQLTGSVDTVALATTDAGQAWTVTIGEGACNVVDGVQASAVVVRGDAETTLLLLWTRRTPDDVEVTGERAVLDHFLGRSDLV